MVGCILDPLTALAPLPMGSAPHAAVAPVSAAPVRRGSSILARSTGLRISGRSTRVPSAVIVAAKKGDRRGAVVCEAQEAAVEVPAVTEMTWQSLVLESDSPVLVEFWASWCGPCRLIHPVIGKLSKDYEGKMKFFKLDTDECEDLANKYGVRSIPTMIIFKSGERKDAMIGAVPEIALVKFVEKFLEQ